MTLNIPYLTTDLENINKAYKIAIGDFIGNIAPYKIQIINKSAPCILAGIDYPTPWVRDAAINVLNAGALICPEASKNTLKSVVFEEDGKYIVSHEQNWDCIIWAIGAKKYYDATHDSDFLDFACKTLIDTFEKYTLSEFDNQLGLFRGPAVYGDGCAAYPDKYGSMPDLNPDISQWAKYYPDEACDTGLGIPMFTLSTNCAYYQAYKILGEFLNLNNQDGNKYFEKAETLKSAINKIFWNETTQNYDYIANECNSHEGLGLAFAILFGVADEEKIKKIANNTHITPNGIACVHPSFQRYLKIGGFGRHSGTVWPFIQSFWARAMLCIKDPNVNNKFDFELFKLTENALNDSQFSEIYHPLTGKPYGGLQENLEKGIGIFWNSCRRQTWSATGYIAMVLDGIIGAQYDNKNISFTPYLPESINKVVLENLNWRGKIFNITIIRNADYPKTANISYNEAENTNNIILSF